MSTMKRLEAPGTHPKRLWIKGGGIGPAASGGADAKGCSTLARRIFLLATRKSAAIMGKRTGPGWRNW